MQKIYIVSEKHDDAWQPVDWVTEVKDLTLEPNDLDSGVEIWLMPEGKKFSANFTKEGNYRLVGGEQLEGKQLEVARDYYKNVTRQELFASAKKLCSDLGLNVSFLVLSGTYQIKVSAPGHKALEEAVVRKLTRYLWDTVIGGTKPVSIQELERILLG